MTVPMGVCPFHKLHSPVALTELTAGTLPDALAGPGQTHLQRLYCCLPSHPWSLRLARATCAYVNEAGSMTTPILECSVVPRSQLYT